MQNQLAHSKLEKGEVLNIMNFKITILKVSSSKIEEIQLEIVDREYN